MDLEQQRLILRLVYESIRELHTMTNLLDDALFASRRGLIPSTDEAAADTMDHSINLYANLVDIRNTLCAALGESIIVDFGDGRSPVSSVNGETAELGQLGGPDGTDLVAAAAATRSELDEPDAEQPPEDDRSGF